VAIVTRPTTGEILAMVSLPSFDNNVFLGSDRDADIEALLRPEHRIIAGAIAGRALYDGRLDAKAALALISERDIPASR
jgi:phosphoribosylformimino-5-aminoimidazole carboxamide ribotide isomerase